VGAGVERRRPPGRRVRGEVDLVRAEVAPLAVAEAQDGPAGGGVGLDVEEEDRGHGPSPAKVHEVSWARGAGYPAAMSTIHDEIARRLAERLAPEIEEDLPDAVERAIAEGGRRGLEHVIDPGLAMQYASFLVSLAALAWTVFKDERARREQHAAAAEQQAALARAAEAEARREAALVEVAYLRGLIEGRLGGEVTVPRGMPEKLRIAAVEAAAEEAVEAGKRERTL
jgi:hypothetical protein